MGPASKQPSSTIEIILVSLDLDPRGSSLLFSSAVLFVSLFYPLPQPPFSYRPLLLFFSFPACSWFSCLPPVPSFVLVPVFKSTIRTDTPAFMESFFLFPNKLPRATHVLSALLNLDGASVNYTLA
ncbi:uncharacterized protein CCOS01_01587 [Colletotrichum costaricense]|uniref:Uncharacterized protein n=1 Tax=Colletotrichum costaricense TaxID=1209916 RepID=A0AAJ0E939_9PEZI|nr:uncharacterized protein CCOS01_01587 [Colletotrichum costaricense]KAK1540273.1 hypothetical protein CCOS01_01587 [Colletotrichum costaricense]